MIFVSLFSKVGFQAESSYSTCKTKKMDYIQANCTSPQEAAMAFANTGHPKWKNCLNSCNLYNLTKCLLCICLQQVFDFTIEITCHFKLVTYPFRPRNWSYRIAISSKITKFGNLNMDNKRQRNRQIFTLNHFNGNFSCMYFEKHYKEGNIEYMYTYKVFAYLAGTSTPEINTCSKANT